MILRLGRMVLLANEENPENVFHPFSKLPPELRIMIWKMNIPAQRIVRLRNMNRFEPGTLYHIELKAMHKVPAILHTNKESRTEGLKIYMSPFYCRLQYPLFFNLSLDVLVFDEHSPCLDFFIFFDVWLNLSGHYENCVHRRNQWGVIQDGLRNLIIANSKRAEIGDWTNYILVQFSQLELLGYPIAVDYLMPNWDIPWPPPGPTWRTLHREWSRRRAGQGAAVRTPTKGGMEEHWKALIDEEVQNMRFILGNESLRQSLGIKEPEDLLQETISKSIKPWPTPTDINFFRENRLQDFLLKLETDSRRC
ncbi:hypothetical protein L207DRAFT_578646 [Hyaloscypha variabilis F]|uniref:2EXR domain-containing protein n=1 Tax=Hyaloscypha variabilis (strain UAMH 11265 / GT02V1 / F) TaxID=1149755 RepID=A0A2J6S4P6_HYAVF|nr:hypothetical protein L207DRAFT_578646 [Hyaloscypha variabilis F]